MKDIRILVVDDEPKQREILDYILKKEGYNVTVASNAEDALGIIKYNDIDVVITDLLLPNDSGMELMDKVRKDFPEISFIIITGHGTIDSAVTAIKKGAFDYIQKPLSKNKVLITLNKAIEHTLLLKERKYLYKRLSEKDLFSDFIGEHPSFKKVINNILKVADLDTTVLITGESGTGKDIAAQYIHKFSNRNNKPFIPINCAAIPESLIESELFGYEKGAFTGASMKRKGLFEAASGGTIFLDEISEISPSVQAKLLRIIQNKELIPLGSNQPLKIDVRIIAATNKKLEDLVKKGVFREDLYYRINVFNIYVPTLRERKSDIPLLINNFINKYKYLNKSNIDKYFNKNAIKLILDYDWPGNVRELESFIQKAILLSDTEEITENDVLIILDIKDGGSEIIESETDISGKSLEQVEKELIIKALNESDWNITKASKKLGISFRTLQYRMGKYGIKKNG